MAHLQFKGKSFVQNHHLMVKYHELVPVKSRSLTKNVSLQDNLIIHGDNLLALKALLPMYAGKVKCIYIDPPYNTGNEKWAYNDNVNSPMMQEWFGKVVDREDLTRHDKWLCMMMPRLRLLKELLHPDGFICVSIGDEEVHHLRRLLEDVFGEENYRNTITVRRYDKNLSRQFFEKGLTSLAAGLEYILVFSLKTSAALAPVFRDATEERQSYGYWKGFWNSADRPTMRYELLGVRPLEGQWKWKEVVAKEAVSNYEEYLRAFSKKESLEEYWARTGSSKKFIRRRPELATGKNLGVEHWVSPSEGILASSHWSDMMASESLEDLGIAFDNPKNVEVIKRVIELTTEPSDIVLDSFAGSGTTAHAVQLLNSEDGGERHFVLVECEEYADKITAERVRRVIKGVTKRKAQSPQAGLGGSFSFFELGKAIEIAGILDGKNLPSYEDLARYVFYTATGEEFVEDRVDEQKNFIGESKNHQVYLLYEADVNGLKNMALTLEIAKKLPALKKDKRRLVFAPTKYLDQDHLDQYKIDFAQLPFEIYELAR